MTRKCGDCDFFQPQTNGYQGGECRKLCPVVVPLSDANSRTEWPWVDSETGWCGAFRGRERRVEKPEGGL